jgi:hypothetical protein
MTFHHTHIEAKRKVKGSRDRRLIRQGMLTLNVWSTMPIIKLGTVADDWNAVGKDMRDAVSQYAEECD